MSPELTFYLYSIIISCCLTLFTNYVRQVCGYKKDLFNINCLVELVTGLIPIVNIVVAVFQIVHICMMYGESFDGKDI